MALTSFSLAFHLTEIQIFSSAQTVDQSISFSSPIFSFLQLFSSASGQTSVFETYLDPVQGSIFQVRVVSRASDFRGCIEVLVRAGESAGSWVVSCQSTCPGVVFQLQMSTASQRERSRKISWVFLISIWSTRWSGNFVELKCLRPLFVHPIWRNKDGEFKATIKLGTFTGAWQKHLRNPQTLGNVGQTLPYYNPKA